MINLAVAAPSPPIFWFKTININTGDVETNESVIKYIQVTKHGIIPTAVGTIFFFD